MSALFALLQGGFSYFFVKSSDTVPCPCCQSPLTHRDYKKRVMKMEGGEKQFLKVERQKCTNPGCAKLHTVLLDCLVPHKHYAAEVISGVLEDKVRLNDVDSEDYPCEVTMYRWKHWLMVNHLRIEGYLKSIGHRLLGWEEGLPGCSLSLLERLQKENDCWLEAALRMIYNSGGFLEPS